MPRVSRATLRQVMRYGKATREGPGDPVMKRTLPGSGSSGGGGGRNDEPYARREFLSQATGVATATTNVFPDGAFNTVGAGGITAVNDATGHYIQYLSSAVAGNSAGWTTSNSQTQIQFVPDWLIVMKTPVTLTNLCFNITLEQTANANHLTHTPANCFGFIFNTENRSDTTWFAHVGNNDAVDANFNLAAGSFVQTDTGVTVSSDTRYVLRVRATTTTTFEWYINGVLVVTTTTSLAPASTTSLRLRAVVFNGTSGAGRAIRLAKWHLFHN